jgi:hypothetical protein
MLTVHQMPLKNQILTGISSGYDKISCQNEAQPFANLSFTNDCTFDFLGKESCRKVTYTFTGIGILCNTSKKQDIGLMFCTGDNDATGTRNTNYVYETSKGKNFKLIFTSEQKVYDENEALIKLKTNQNVDR